MQKAIEKSSPFDKYDFRENGVFVGVENQEFQLLKMDTLPAAHLVELFKTNYEEDWQKRFSEDFVEYLNRLNIYPNNPESFTLIDNTGNTIIKEMAFDKKKRSKAKAHYEANYEKAVDIEKVLSKSEAHKDIEQLKEIIGKKYSYVFLNDINIDDEVSHIKKQIGEDISVYELALLINKLLNKYGDGHSRVKNINFKEQGVLPFSTRPFNGKVLCTKDKKLINENYPFLHAVNGVKTAELIQVSEAYLTPDASPQFKKRVSINRLNRIGTILKILGKYSEELSITLESEDGQIFNLNEKIKKIKSKDEMSLIEKTRQLNKMQNYNPFETKTYGDIGYLKIKSMVSLKEELPINQLKESKALIIDVRGNGGGARTILMNLAPHFISEKQKFVIGNVSRLRTDMPTRNHSLKDRYLYQSNDEYFDEKIRKTISTWVGSFTENVELNDSLYTPNYYLYLENAENPLFAETPTVILMDAGCFSATDIFLSTFKEIDDVTLIGTPSGGGSGRAKGYKLTNSLIEVKLSSMVSFQPNGKLYDGVGVEPDLLVEQEQLSDFLNQTDHQLDFAINYLNKKI